MTYDLIIIGAGAAGLFAGASLSSPINGLIIDKSSLPGKKLLMSGGGQCNITHGGDIKDFVQHYGLNGKKIRSVLYHFNNRDVVNFFETAGIHFVEREDGKIFPQSLRAKDVLDVLVRSCLSNGLHFKYDSPVTNIKIEHSGCFCVVCENIEYYTKKIIVAVGGSSYPATGSDGSLFPIIKGLGIDVTPTKPALAPLYVKNYPYKALAGISFAQAKVSIKRNQTGPINNAKQDSDSKLPVNTDALLLTHTCFSGPAILNSSRYAATGDELTISYYTKKSPECMLEELKTIMPGNQKLINTVLYEYLNPDLRDSVAEIPKRFIESICERCGIDFTRKFSQLSGKDLTAIIKRITAERFEISHLGGFNTAMVTAGGVNLDEINLKTMESKKIQGLYFAGEVLDVDGDTGGYNLQFAFSTGYIAGSQI